MLLSQNKAMVTQLLLNCSTTQRKKTAFTYIQFDFLKKKKLLQSPCFDKEFVQLKIIHFKEKKILSFFLMMAITLN